MIELVVSSSAGDVGVGGVGAGSDSSVLGR